MSIIFHEASFPSFLLLLFLCVDLSSSSSRELFHEQRSLETCSCGCGQKKVLQYWSGCWERGLLLVLLTVNRAVLNRLSKETLTNRHDKLHMIRDPYLTATNWSRLSSVSMLSLQVIKRTDQSSAKHWDFALLLWAELQVLYLALIFQWCCDRQQQDPRYVHSYSPLHRAREGYAVSVNGLDRDTALYIWMQGLQSQCSCGGLDLGMPCSLLCQVWMWESVACCHAILTLFYSRLSLPVSRELCMHLYAWKIYLQFYYIHKM